MSDGLFASATKGNTRYEVRGHGPSPGMVTIYRFNSDGEKAFHVPRELFDAYARNFLVEEAKTIAEEAVAKVIARRRQ